MKNKTNKFSTFKYNPKGGILCISTNEALGFNFNTNKFEINQNPEGNSKFNPGGFTIRRSPSIRIFNPQYTTNINKK